MGSSKSRHLGPNEKTAGDGAKMGMVFGGGKTNIHQQHMKTMVTPGNLPEKQEKRGSKRGACFLGKYPRGRVY